jgi:F-type H+-transporting ATPase subunit b
MSFPVCRRAAVWIVGSVLLTVFQARAPSAAEHSPHGAAATAGSADSQHAVADHGDVDYNKPPLPGFAPGLGTLFGFSLVLFVAFVFGARTLVWTPLIQALDQREARVNRAHADAEAAKAEAERLMTQHEARMAQVHEEVQAIVVQARKEAEREKARIIAEAEAQARAVRDQALAEIRRAREAALADLERSLDGAVTEAVAHVVGEAL